MSRVPVLEDLPPLEGKRVLLRADFNVPVQDGRITDDLRIRAALPTIEWLGGQGATVVACTHFGRPKGEPNPKYSVEPIRARLAELAPGVELLENLRFDKGEEGNDPAYGARPLRRLIQTAIGDRLAKEILAGEIVDGDTVRVDRFEDGLIVGPAR